MKWNDEMWQREEDGIDWMSASRKGHSTEMTERQLKETDESCLCLTVIRSDPQHDATLQILQPFQINLSSTV